MRSGPGRHEQNRADKSFHPVSSHLEYAAFALFKFYLFQNSAITQGQILVFTMIDRGYFGREQKWPEWGA
jgi:hypothetical protein